MKNKTLKLILAGASLALFVVAILMFLVSFLDQVTSGVLNGTKSLFTGFEIFSTDALDANYKLGTIFAFAFVVLGALSACYAVAYVLLGKKSKKSKGNKNAKLLCALCTFVLVALVPAILLFLTKQTTGVALDVHAGVFGGTETKLGVGAVLAAVFSLVGGCALSLEEVL